MDKNFTAAMIDTVLDTPNYFKAFLGAALGVTAGLGQEAEAATDAIPGIAYTVDFASALIVTLYGALGAFGAAGANWLLSKAKKRFFNDKRTKDPNG